MYKMLGDKKSLETNSTRGYEIHNVHKKVQAWQHKKQHKTRQDIYRYVKNYTILKHTITWFVAGYGIYQGDHSNSS